MPTMLVGTFNVRPRAYSGATTFSREKTIVHLLQSFSFDMCIDLGGGDGRVSEHRLDGPEIGTAFEQMSRERMPQHVR